MLHINLDVLDILKINRENYGVIISQNAYENCSSSIENVPVVMKGTPIGHVLDASGTIEIYKNIEANYKLKESHIENGYTIVDDFELVSLEIV